MAGGDRGGWAAVLRAPQRPRGLRHARRLRGRRLRRDADLNWYINPDNGGQAEIAEALHDAARTGRTDRDSVLPRDAPSQREQLVRRLAAGDYVDRHHESRPAVHRRVRPGRLPRAGARRRRSRGQQGVVAGRSEVRDLERQLVAVPFWANTQLLWYRKSVAEAAGLDMTQAGHLGPADQGGPGSGEAAQHPGPARGVADGVVQRAHRVGRRPHHREGRRQARQNELGLDSDGGQTRRARSCGRSPPPAVAGHSTASEDAGATDSRARTPGSWSTGPTSGPGPTAVDGGHARPVRAGRLRLDAVPAGRREHAVRTAVGGVNLGIWNSASTRLRVPGGRVHHQRREPGRLLRRPTATPLRRPPSTTTRTVQKNSRRPRDPAVPRRPPPRGR